jgi:hypothetical protein
MSKLKNLMMWRGTYLIAGAFIAAVVFFCYLSTPNLKAPIEAQLEAIQIEDMATAYAYTSATFQKTTSLDAFKRFVSQYSGLRNNESIKFDDREVKHGVGIVKATLIARGGSKTIIHYQLAKENDRWKIESMVVIPQDDEDGVDNGKTMSTAALNDVITDKPATAPVEAPATTNKPAVEEAPVEKATNVYQDEHNHYELTYPTTWEYTQAEKNMVILHKKNVGTPNAPLLSIQPVASSNESAHPSVNQLVEQGENDLKEKSGSFKVVEDGLLPPRANKNESFHGRYAVYSYTLDNQPYKQLQVIYFRSPSRAQFVIDFISPEAQFEADLPAARAMIASFTIS